MKWFGRVGVGSGFEIRDLWVGVFWRRWWENPGPHWFTMLYICVIPTLPIKVCVRGRRVRETDISLGARDSQGRWA